MNSRDISRPHFFEAGKNNTVLLLLHGTGGDENGLTTLGRALDPEATYLAPRGMVIESGMNRFFERYSDGSFNEESIDEAVEDLKAFIEAAVKHYGLKGKKLIATGFSNGANTAAALLIRKPEILNGAILFGSTKPYKEVAPVDLNGKKVWLANGDQDPYAPVTVSEEWVTQLKGFGADVVWLRHPGGHQIAADHVRYISEEL